VVVDYITHLTGVWWVPTILPFRILGQVPVEDLLWAISLFYYTIMFYEFFYDAHRDKRIVRPQLKFLILIAFTLVISFLVIFYTTPQLLFIPFFYFWFGMILVSIPIIIEFFRKPTLLHKFLPTAVYFFYVSFVYEITALKLKLWIFPTDKVLGRVILLGVEFPFEEFFFWFMLTAMSCLAYYEIWDDDEM
jgi:hypothetical protein